MPLQSSPSGAAAVHDYVVIGSGSTGAVVAARLSESGSHTVACLEAGTRGAGYLWTRAPAAVGHMIENPEVNWCRYAQANAGLAGRRIYLPAGKLVGGTSALNGMIFNRGQRMDYDGWARMGCPGWSYADVLPYFKRLESTDIGSDEFRGRTGPMRVTLAEKTSPFFDLFIASAQACGWPLNPDYAGPTQHGVAMAQVTVHRGMRQSTATQYLQPARGRSNLQLITGAEVSALILERGRCVGLRYRRGGAMHELRAAREVILCAGAVGSPKLLELSGIGDPAVLSRHGIAIARALPGVGRNLRDHFGPPLQWTFRDAGLSLAGRGSGWRLARELARYLMFRTGFMSQGWCTMRAFVRSQPDVAQADIALLANPYLVDVKGKRRVMSPVNGFFMWAQVQRPESTGSVHIQSADPFQDPAVEVSFLATENDRRLAVLAVRRARELVAQPPLADAIEREVLPGPAVETDAQILEFIRQHGSTTFHLAGTCRMGRDPMAVVDERLRVHGIGGLRVADASIMPTLVSGNTSIPCVMIGEKCADMVLADAAQPATGSAHPIENETCVAL
ncbi:GMC family oxidoreductase N-terminal domain-containing protein [Xylophilus sp. GW821-FHT01B05]